MKILLAYDGFEYSRHALEEAAKMAAGEDSTVTVVSVVPPSARGTKSAATSVCPRMRRRTSRAPMPFSVSAASSRRRRFVTAIRPTS